MGDLVPVEKVAAHPVIRAQQAQMIARHGPKQRTFPHADGAIAGDGRGDVAFDLEGDLSAVTASLVEHAFSPSLESLAGIAESPLGGLFFRMSFFCVCDVGTGVAPIGPRAFRDLSQALMRGEPFRHLALAAPTMFLYCSRFFASFLPEGIVP
jgi:hypothetical protein